MNYCLFASKQGLLFESHALFEGVNIIGMGVNIVRIRTWENNWFSYIMKSREGFIPFSLCLEKSKNEYTNEKKRNYLREPGSGSSASAALLFAGCAKENITPTETQTTPRRVTSPLVSVLPRPDSARRRSSGRLPERAYQSPPQSTGNPPTRSASLTVQVPTVNSAPRTSGINFCKKFILGTVGKC